MSRMQTILKSVIRFISYLSLKLIGSIKHWLGLQPSARVLNRELLDLCKMVSKRDNLPAYRYFRIGCYILYRDEFNRFYIQEDQTNLSKVSKSELASWGLVIALGAMMLWR